MNGIALRGLNGANPLGFLAALGTVRLATILWPDRRIRMSWERDGQWRPVLFGAPAENGGEFCELLIRSDVWAPLESFAGLGQNLTVRPDVFRQAITSVTGDNNPVAAGFLASFGSEVAYEEDKNRIEYTDLSFIAGSGHQHFLGTAKALRACSAEHLKEALFGPWRFAQKSKSFRWDPEDAREYALQWENPGSVGVYTVWGANRLAFEALPLFPTFPMPAGLGTTGFAIRDRAHEFTWPIWQDAVTIDTVRSLVGMAAIQEPQPDRGLLQPMGIVEVFRAQRVRIGQGAHFKVSFRPARAV